MTPYLIHQNIRVIFYMTLVLFANCNTQRSLKASIVKIDLIVNYPLVQPPNFILTDLKDTIPVYYYNSIYLYKFPVNRSIENEERILRIEKGYTFFIFSKESDYGYWFNSIIDLDNGIRLSVDSVLRKRGYKTDFALLVDSLRNTSTKINGDTTLTEYVFRNWHSEIAFDSVFFYFSKSLKNFDYSFSRDLDSINDSKLFRVRLLCNEKYSKIYNALLPKREFLFEFKNSTGQLGKAEEIEFRNLIKRMKILDK